MINFILDGFKEEMEKVAFKLPFKVDAKEALEKLKELIPGKFDLFLKGLFGGAGVGLGYHGAKRLIEKKPMEKKATPVYAGAKILANLFKRKAPTTGKKLYGDVKHAPLWKDVRSIQRQKSFQTMVG